jgi:hypothetical protein
MLRPVYVCIMNNNTLKRAMLLDIEIGRIRDDIRVLQGYVDGDQSPCIAGTHIRVGDYALVAMIDRLNAELEATVSEFDAL